MKYFDLLSATGFHTSIATTFCIDFDAYESVVLARLREAGSTNNIVLVDARLLAQSLSAEMQLPQSAGRRYTAVGINPRGVFHPKLILQLGSSEARLVVSSGNLTASGIGGNLEVFGELRASESNPALAPLIGQALRYVEPLLKKSPATTRQLDWALARTRWLERFAPAEKIQVGGKQIAFFTNSAGAAVGQTFVTAVRRRSVRRLIVLSPYWDHDLSAAKELARQIAARDVCLVLNPSTGLFPKTHGRLPKGWSLQDVTKAGEWAKGRFAHAKIFIAETEDADLVLYGSANCTEAALGLRGEPANEEASLFYELAAGETVRHLKLNAALARSGRIELEDLPEYDEGEKIPLSDLARGLPGDFLLNGRSLTWSIPPALRTGTYELQFFAQDGTRLDVGVSTNGWNPQERFFELQANVEPHFVRVVGQGFESSLGIVQVQQALAQNQRGSVSKPVREALEFLDDDEAAEGVWILEIIHTLSRSEHKAVPERRPKRRPEMEEADSPKTLTYEEFIRGRERAQTSRSGASSLASSHMDSVRAFLNFLVGRSSEPVGRTTQEPLPAPNLGLGDETGDAENSIEEGDELRPGQRSGSVDEEQRRISKLKRHQQYIKDTQASIADAVRNFVLRSRARAETEALTAVDVLRLRALLMVVLASGTTKSQLLQPEFDPKSSRRLVLPSRGDSSWPLLCGQLLFAFFRRHEGAAPPLLYMVEVQVEKDGSLPVDLLEAWVTCLWTACASLLAIDQKGAPVPPTTFQLALTRDVYACLSLPDALSDSENVMELLNGLTQRYGGRLGVDGAKLTDLHRHRGVLQTLPNNGAKSPATKGSRA